MERTTMNPSTISDALRAARATLSALKTARRPGGVPPSPLSQADPATPDRPTFDAAAVQDTVRRALAAAGLDGRSGLPAGVTDVVRRALAAGGLADVMPPAASAPVAPSPGHGEVIDGVTRWVDAARDGLDALLRAPPGALPGAVPEPAADEAPAGPVRPGEFASRQHSGPAGTRTYKLYVPTGYRDDGPPLPLVVMLHGCTQHPDDFAAGTRMNELAERHGFLVAYPAQTKRANGSNCWNWFRTVDQQAGGQGEPAILAALTREVMAGYRVDPARVYVTGLSAGAAMAVILGETHPDLFAAIGAHSGLPYAAAHDMPSAFAAMHGGAAAGPEAATTHRVPTIVFHGDQDATVTPANGAEIVRRATPPGLTAFVEDGTASGGRRWHRTVHAGADGRPQVEQWIVHGAGHAWSGGSPQGSYTDAAGPDASAEMVRFFLEAGRRGEEGTAPA